MKAKSSWCLIVLLAASAPVVADESGEAWSEGPDAVTARMMAAVRVIEKNHIDPPPRQELVHRLVRSLAERFHRLPPFGAGRDLSLLTEDAEFENYLRTFCGTLSDLTTTRSDAQLLREREQLALQDVVNSLLGPNHVRSAKEQAVEDQLASNRYVGIGIALGLDQKNLIPQMNIVVENGPAQRAGATEEDLILEIDGELTRGMQIKDVVERLRGPAGSQVTLVLRQPDVEENRELTITRGVVPLKHVLLTRDGGVNVIKISDINASVVQELREIEEELGEETGEIVLEFQSRGPSNLHHAVMLADALVDGGSIGRVRTSSGVREFEAARECLFHDVSLKVRTLDFTAGPAEWVIAALQDSGRATVIGQRTAGLPFVTESFDVPGTNWVLVLVVGVLERADGTPLLRTDLSQSHGKWRTAVMLPQHDASRESDDHSGGVIPDTLSTVKAGTGP